MSRNNSAHQALKSRRVQTLPSDLKDRAEMLIAEKFDLTIAKEGSDILKQKVEQQFTPPPQQTIPIIPRAMRDPGSYMVRIVCGRCNWQYVSEHMQQLGMNQYQTYTTSASSLLPPQPIQRHYNFSCPGCGAANNGMVYI